MSQANNCIWLNICGESSGVGYFYEDGTNLNSEAHFYAMSILTRQAAVLQSVTVNLSITGGPANIRFDLCTSNAANNPDIATGILGSAYLITPVHGQNTVIFTPAISLAANTQYYLVIRGNSTTDYVDVRRISQGVLPTFTYNRASGRCDNFKMSSTDSGNTWGSSYHGTSQLFVQYADGSWFGCPLWGFGAGGSNIIIPNQWFGNVIVMPADATDTWLSSVHFPCRTMGTLTIPTMLAVFENNNIIAQKTVTLGSASTNEINGSWADRVLYLDQPVKLRGGNKYFIGLVGTSQCSGGAYIQISGVKCAPDKHQCLPLSAVRAYRTVAGAMVEEPGYLVGMALGIDLVNPFAPKPINRRKFNAQR